jgi:photosystem II stability/assembly factor-like uncharacterized protein
MSGNVNGKQYNVKSFLRELTMQKPLSVLALFVVVITLDVAWQLTAIGQTDYWQQTNGPYGGQVLSLASDSSSNVYIGTYGDGIYRTTNQGINWTRNGLKGKVVCSLGFYSPSIAFASAWGELHRSTDGGNTWNLVFTNSNVYIISEIAFNYSTGSVFAGTNDGVFRSTDNGGSWMTVNN